MIKGIYYEGKDKNEADRTGIKGYYLDTTKSSIPSESGIYCAYKCIYSETERKVSICELIYIGQSQDLSERLSSHDKHIDWEENLKRGDTMLFICESVRR